MANETTLDVIVQMNIQAAKAELTKLRNIVGTIGQKDILKKTNPENFKDLQKQMNILNKMRYSLGKNNKTTQEQKKIVDELNHSLGLTKGQITKVRHENKRFSFDFLTLLFTGMILKKTFGGMFKNILDNYKKIMGTNSQFNRSLLKLQAGFGYLKFSIANALNSPGVIRAIQSFTDWIIQAGDYLGEHPGLSQTILGVISSLSTIGSLAIIGGGVKQVGMLFGIMGSTKAEEAISNLSNLAAIGAIEISIGVGWKTTKDLKKGSLNFIDIIKGGLASALGGYGFLKLFTSFTTKELLTSSLLIGIATMGILAGIAIIFDAKKSLDKSLEMAPGKDKVWALLLGSAKGIFGGAVAGAFAGAAVGSVIPGAGSIAGAVVGALLGTITAGIWIIIKLLPHIDLPDITSNEIANNVDMAIPKSIDFNKDIDLRNTTLHHLPSDPDFKPLPDDVLQSFKNMKSNTDEATKAITKFSDYNIDTLKPAVKNTSKFTNSFAINQNTLNTHIKTGTDLLPGYNENVESNISKTQRQANATNNAAAAQERLNRAIANRSNDSNNWFGNVVNNTLSSFSTSTQSSAFTH